MPPSPDFIVHAVSAPPLQHSVSLSHAEPSALQSFEPLLPLELLDELLLVPLPDELLELLLLAQLWPLEQSPAPATHARCSALRLAQLLSHALSVTCVQTVTKCAHAEPHETSEGPPPELVPPELVVVELEQATKAESTNDSAKGSGSLMFSAFAGNAGTDAATWHRTDVHTVGLVVYPQFQALGLAVTTVFEYANILAGPTYAVSIVSEHGGLVRASQGIIVESESLADRSFDTLVVTGDNEATPPSAGLLDYLRRAAAGAKRIASICTGAFVLARAGLLDDRRATTHWQYTAPFRAEFPRVQVEEDKLFVVDGAMWTSAGMSAGIDLALALVEADLGVERARDIAKKLVVYNRRTGAQPQQSALLSLDARSDRVQTVLAFAREHLTEDLSVDVLADVAHLSRRHFTRLFKEETGQSPAEAVETLRVEAARTMIESGRHSTDEIATDTGFENPERMRRAFVRAFGKPPQAFRRDARRMAT